VRPTLRHGSLDRHRLNQAEAGVDAPARCDLPRRILEKPMRSGTALWRPAPIRATLVTLVVVGHAWLGGATPAHAQHSDVDPRRSLAVTDQAILERFPLQRVLDQLVAQSGVPGLTSLALFHQ